MSEDKIYLLKTDLQKNNEYLYKIGRSKQQHLKRLTNYPKTWKIIITRSCIDCIYVETELIKLFTKKYKKEFKNEYFVGNENEMIMDINKTINDEYETHNLTKELIIIKSKINETGQKRYYITDHNHNVLREIIDTNHIEWILTHDFADTEDSVYIEENILYDINDEKIIKYIKSYCSVIGEAKNIYKDIDKHILKDKYENIFHIAFRQDEYSNLSINGKIVYLFEANTLIDNLDGYYCEYGDKLLLFSVAPTFIFEASKKMYDDSFFIKNDIFIHYFREIGTIKYLKSSCRHFNIINDENSKKLAVSI
jgi:hypothetical protein